LSTKIKYTEDALVDLLKKRDSKAFDVLYENYSRALLGVIKKIVPDEVISEDVLQDVFVKIWSNSGQYDVSKGRLYTWMLNIARNTAIDYVRSKSNKFDEKIQRGENTVHQVSRSNNVEINIDRIGVRSIINELKEDQRILIDLAYFEGFTQEEISQKLGIPLGTIKTRVRAALMTLRKLVQ
jgi:RNA polymerase sigma factor (sigma-70 family)